MRRLLFFASIWFTAVPGIAVVHPRALGPHRARGSDTDRAGHRARRRRRHDDGRGDRRYIHADRFRRWRPAEGDATGGGPIVHHFGATNTDATGVYVVTGFIS
jgi:hypothetical protein